MIRRMLTLVTIGCSMLVCCGRADGPDLAALEIPARFEHLQEYGVTFSKPDTSLGAGVRGYYIVRFLNAGNDSLYEVVDSFPTSNEPLPTACDANAVAHLDRRGDCFTLRTIELGDDSAHDSVLTICGYSDRNPVFMFHYLRPDSILVLTEMINSGEAPGIQVVVTRLSPVGGIDTMAVIRDLWGGPRLSLDKTELFFNVLRPGSGPPRDRFTVGVYDLRVDSLIFPVDTSYRAYYVFRSDRDSPLYYVRSDSLDGLNIWRRDKSGPEQQITFHRPPEIVGEYILMADSLQYRLHGGTAQEKESEIISIELPTLPDQTVR